MSPRRPGIAKVRAVPLATVRRVTLARLSASRGAALLETADVISEGGESPGADGRPSYFGSTSLLVALPRHDAEDADVLAALFGDVHLRVLALRLAREEAASRASGAAGTMRAEISLRRAGEVIEIVVDLELQLVRPARRRARE